MTVSNLSVSASGAVTAAVIAACGATTANFTLKVTDSDGLFSTLSLSVTVNPNSNPTLTYHDFLNRETLNDPDGWAFWTNQIRECQQAGATCNAEVRRINVSPAFFLSIEFQETGYLVERLYKTAYGDAIGLSNFGPSHTLPAPVIRFEEFQPDTQAIGQGVVVGQGNWQAVLNSNKQAFIAEFVQRARFLTAFPSNLAAAEFVDRLNANAGNPLSPVERIS